MTDTPLAPNSPDAEEAVLGSILIAPETIHEIAPILAPDDFFIKRNGWVFEAMLALAASRDEIGIDNLTLAEELRRRGRLDDLGGPARLTYLMNNCPTHIHAGVYARIVERAAIRRKLLRAAQEVATAAIREDADIMEVVSDAERAIFAVTQRQVAREAIPLPRAAQEFFREIEARLMMSPEERRAGLPTGFADLDKLLGGLKRGEFIVVGARPGAGKTSFLLNAALNAARIAQARIAFFSLEMTIQSLTERLYAMETGLNSQKFQRADIDEREFGLTMEAAARLDRLPIFLDDTPHLTIQKLRSKALRLHREVGLDAVFLDYVGLMTAGEKTENRQQEVSLISRNLKELAKELNVPVVAAAQLNRELEARKDKRPQLADLRESGSLEQDSDAVLFIYRDEMYNDATERPSQADIMLEKHRNGPTGVITLYFQKDTTSFRSMTRARLDLAGFQDRVPAAYHTEKDND